MSVIGFNNKNLDREEGGMVGYLVKLYVWIFLVFLNFAEPLALSLVLFYEVLRTL